MFNDPVKESYKLAAKWDFPFSAETTKDYMSLTTRS